MSMKTIIMYVFGIVAAIGSVAVLALLALIRELGRFCDDVMGDDM